MNVIFEKKDNIDNGEERCFNTSCENNKDTRSHPCDNGCEYTRNTGKCKNFKGKGNDTHQVGTIFSVLNEKDAAPYIGRIVECCDPTEYRKGEWNKGLFEKLRGEESEYPFAVEVEGSEIYTLIRLIPESFETPKPKVDPGLIEALKKSIQQWQIMHDTGKKKEDVYKFLGGENGMGCFLCDSAGRVKDGGTEHCHKCIDWKASYCYNNRKSPFYVWREDQCKGNTLLMLNHLKSELSRLDGKQ